jgi:DNA polymerase-3 subunit delta'
VLKGAITSGKPGHAYLFHGAGGVGKTTTALEFAKALNCERGGPEACGECLTCRRAEHGNLRDIEIIEPGSKSGQTIEIEQVRELISRANTRPTEGKRKVFLLPQASRLSPPAMQTLLKTLEEPPEFVTLILETQDLTDLLPTLISRCQTVRFRSLPKETIERILQSRKAPPARISTAAAYAQGSVGEALALAGDNAAWKRREQTLELLTDVSRMPRARILRAAEDLQKLAAVSKGAKSSEADADGTETDGDNNAEPDTAREGPAPPRNARTGLAEVLRVVSAWYGDLLALQAGADESKLRNPDRLDDLRTALSSYSHSQLFSALDAILRAEYSLRRNANPRLLSENLMARLCP